MKLVSKTLVMPARFCHPAGRNQTPDLSLADPAQIHKTTTLSPIVPSYLWSENFALLHSTLLRLKGH